MSNDVGARCSVPTKITERRKRYGKCIKSIINGSNNINICNANITYLFATFGNYSKNINDNINQKEKQEFNAQFTKYETSGTGELCTVYDIVTIINLAKNCNDQYEEYQGNSRINNYNSENNSYIYVTIIGETDINEKTEESILTEYINQHNSTTNGEYNNKYNCKVNISNQTGLVKSIIFTKKKRQTL